MQKLNIEPLQKIDFKILEEIKQIRTNIRLLGPDIKVINITSAVGREGKSLVSFWLAHTLADSGKKVILIDGNLRKIEKVNIFEISKEFENDKDIHNNKVSHNKKLKDSEQLLQNDFLTGKTLKKYLMGKAKKDDIIFESNINNMYFILSGHSAENASELLSEYSFGALISYLRDSFDYIIIDTPAIGEVTDGVIIAQHCDGSILIMEPGIVNYQLAERVQEQLKFGKSKLLGVVLNKVYS